MFAFKQCYQTGHFIRTKSDEKCQNSRYQKVRLSDAVERKRSQICKLNLWMATTAVAFFCQTPKFAKNFFFFFCFLKLRQEGAKKSNFMLTTITRNPLLLSMLRLDTRLKRQSRKQRFSLVVQKGKLELKGSFLHSTRNSLRLVHVFSPPQKKSS